MCDRKSNEHIRKPVGFMKQATEYLEKISYKNMKSAADLEDVFKLRRDAYFDVGYLAADEPDQFYDDLDFVPNVFHVGIYHQGELVSAVRLHSVDKDTPDSCATGIFPQAIHSLVSESKRLIDTSRFSSRPSLKSSHPFLPLATIRATGLLAIHHNADAVLSTVVSDHMKFYRRILGAVEIAEPEPYADLRNPLMIHLLSANMSELKKMAQTERQFFLSAQAERELLFDGLPGIEVHPTAQLILTGAIVDPVWS